MNGIEELFYFSNQFDRLNEQINMYFPIKITKLCQPNRNGFKRIILIKMFNTKLYNQLRKFHVMPTSLHNNS